MDVTSHYTKGDLMGRLEKALREDGADPADPTLEQLAPYDHFHGRGLEATVEMLDPLKVGSHDHLLDIGSGIGGPARYLARRFGCRVTGIDLTEEFVKVARQLTERLDMQERVRFEHGDALAMPFMSGSFGGAYSMNVSMNIEDKDRLYREVKRVLQRGGWLLLSELAQGPGPAIDYPTPWAATKDSSFLQTAEETSAALRLAGFRVHRVEEKLKQAMAYGKRSREIVEKGGKPPHRAVELIHGEGAKQVMANMSAGLKEGRVVPIEVFAESI